MTEDMISSDFLLDLFFLANKEDSLYGCSGEALAVVTMRLWCSREW